jgi:hypothetical protein
MFWVPQLALLWRFMGFVCQSCVRHLRQTLGRDVNRASDTKRFCHRMISGCKASNRRNACDLIYLIHLREEVFAKR